MKSIYWISAIIIIVLLIGGIYIYSQKNSSQNLQTIQLTERFNEDIKKEVTINFPIDEDSAIDCAKQILGDDAELYTDFEVYEFNEEENTWSIPFGCKEDPGYPCGGIVDINFNEKTYLISWVE